jgi:N-acetyl sugar amidotransferase
MSELVSCKICVMNSTVSDIIFDKNGQCNYCKKFIKKIDLIKKTKFDLDQLVLNIKSKKKNSKYDCIVGLSGGIDSSYTLTKVVELGLKPLAVHMDNGWNSELAQSNIENLVKSLKVDLYTYVIEWSEYRSMMESFFESDVLDIELLMDNAMLSVNYEMAKKENLQFILSGSNTSTEGMDMPKNMNWIKFDKKNIESIIKIFGNNKIKTYPSIGVFDLVRYIIQNKIKWINFLDYFDYKKDKATKFLEEKYNFKPYEYKHYESIFTRFYQGYILPKKFKIDKRILHLSTLIITNQITRNDAIKLLARQPYSSEIKLKEDKEYFLKKMNWTEKKLKNYIQRPAKSHYQYPNSRFIYECLLKFYKLIKIRV